MGQALDDDGITAEWQMRPVLLGGADGYDEARVASQMGPDLGGSQILDP